MSTSVADDLAAKVGDAPAIQFDRSSCVVVREVGAAELVAPQQSVAVGQAFRRPLSEPPAAVRRRVPVARLHRQAAPPKTADVVDAVVVVRVELIPVAVSQALHRPRVHVARVDAAQERRHRRDLALRQQPANIIIIIIRRSR